MGPAGCGRGKSGAEPSAVPVHKYHMRMDSGGPQFTPADHRSVSTWQQPDPPHASPSRSEAIDRLARRILRLSPGRLRVAVDGRTGAGKTMFGHELGAAIRHRGRPTLRASLDDFKHPWRHAAEHGYDRTTGAGYYRNAYDFESARELLLRPSGPAGDGRVALCAHDPLTGRDHRRVLVFAPADSVLIVDSVFAFRPEYDEFWDYRIWLEVEPSVALERGVGRDQSREGAEEAARVHAERYGTAEEIYIAEVDPRRRADAVLDNTDLPGLRITRL